MTWNIAKKPSKNTYLGCEKIVLENFPGKTNIQIQVISYLPHLVLYCQCTMFASDQILPPGKALPAFRQPCQAVASQIREIHMTRFEKYTWQYQRNTHDSIWEIYLALSEKYNWDLISQYCRPAKSFLPSGNQARQSHLESEKYA